MPGFLRTREIRRLTARNGLVALRQKPRSTVPDPERRTWPWRPGTLVIDQPDHVWCADITGIPVRPARHPLSAVDRRAWAA
jgi:putative transposase